MHTELLNDPYINFVKGKIAAVKPLGFPCDESLFHPRLKAHQRTICATAVRMGCYLIAAAAGLGKTNMQIEICRVTLDKLVEDPDQCLDATPWEHAALIVIPLGVRQEFLRDARDLGVNLTFIRHTREAQDGTGRVIPGIYLTNYEAIAEGNVDPSIFAVTSLDEGDVLRSFGSKTFGELCFGPMMQVPYRFVATATPAPSETLQIIAYAHYLGVMDMGECKTRFFKRNSEKADDLTLHAHMEQEFWHWVSSWSCWVQFPSDLGAEYPDDGYITPPVVPILHKVPVDHSAFVTIQNNGQVKLLRDNAVGVVEASKEKRDTLPARIAKMVEIIQAGAADEDWLIWHDTNAERDAIKKALPDCVTITGTDSLEVREKQIIDFSDGLTRMFAAKPSIAGVGCNFQRHCHKMIFVGIGFKFKEFIQAILRLKRFLQTFPVEVHIIYAESEQGVWELLERRWKDDDERRDMMSELIRTHGLSTTGALAVKERSSEVERQESIIRGQDGATLATMIKNDSVIELRRWPDNSFGMIFTSIPFSTQYEYTPSLLDFGHNLDAIEFWRQMDHLTPELLRTLQPGRVFLLHVKDRAVPGGMRGIGYQTIDATHCHAYLHYIRHGFDFLGQCTIATDVVRENKQTERLGWTQKCKDGSRMGFGLSEYLMAFRKPPTDHSNGYADVPVRRLKATFDRKTKAKTNDGYSRGQWQIDAAGYWLSDGEHGLTPAQLALMNRKDIWRAWKRQSVDAPYDYAAHVELAEMLEARGALPPDYALIPVHLPSGPDDNIWTDITRMRTINMELARRQLAKHLCPLPYDIVDRGVNLFSMPGETILDPFGGAGTLAVRAIQMGRKAVTIELNADYWQHSCMFAQAAATKVSMPTLFELDDEDGDAADGPEEGDMDQE